MSEIKFKVENMIFDTEIEAINFINNPHKEENVEAYIVVYSKPYPKGFSRKDVFPMVKTPAGDILSGFQNKYKNEFAMIALINNAVSARLPRFISLDGTLSMYDFFRVANYSELNADPFKSKTTIMHKPFDMASLPYNFEEAMNVVSILVSPIFNEEGLV